MEDNQKPPTQTLGVVGFKADIYGNEPIKWNVLIHLPKFQMYAFQATGGSYGDSSNIMEWIMGYVSDRAQTYGEKNLFKDYVKWHDEKGYWKAEDVFGNLLEEADTNGDR